MRNSYNNSKGFWARSRFGGHCANLRLWLSKLVFYLLPRFSRKVEEGAAVLFKHYKISTSNSVDRKLSTDLSLDKIKSEKFKTQVHLQKEVHSFLLALPDDELEMLQQILDHIDPGHRHVSEAANRISAIYAAIGGTGTSTTEGYGITTDESDLNNNLDLGGACWIGPLPDTNLNFLGMNSISEESDAETVSKTKQQIDDELVHDQFQLSGSLKQRRVGAAAEAGIDLHKDISINLIHNENDEDAGFRSYSESGLPTGSNSKASSGASGEYLDSQEDDGSNAVMNLMRDSMQTEILRESGTASQKTSSSAMGF